MSFSVLRTLDYRRAGFDKLKQTAITQLGSGINAKLNVQFNSRIWNSAGSTGSIYTDQPFQSGWDVTRGQAGATGIFVEYPGANVAKSMAQSDPYTTTDTNSQVTKFAQQLLTQMEPIFPGISNQWNRKAMLSTPFTDPNFLCSYSFWKPGQYTGFSGYEKKHPLRRRALLAGLPGLHGGRRIGGRPRRGRDPRRPEEGIGSGRLEGQAPEGACP